MMESKRIICFFANEFLMGLEKYPEDKSSEAMEFVKSLKMSLNKLS